MCKYHYQNLNDIIYSSWDIEQNILKLVILGHFLPFYPLKTPKIKIFKKQKKFAGDIIILHMCNKNHFNHMMYGSWDTERDKQNFVILDCFLPFYSTMDLENQNFEKMKKLAGDIIILHMCTKSHFNHMIYGSWDTEWDKQNFLSFWTAFCPFTPLWTWKIKILKKWKKLLKILSFYKCAPKMTVIWCMFPEIWSATDRIFCHYGPFFALLHP